MRFFTKKVFIKVLKWSFISFIFLFIWANFWINFESKKFVKSDINSLPNTKVGLVLGTSKLLKNGNINPFFQFRAQATYDLYQAGKIRKILISGDNSIKEYNEPEDMKNTLISMGIPEQNIFLDFAGFDTYDSMIRANKIFGQEKFIVISQDFHAQRAVYIARRFDLEVWGFSAKDVAKSKSFLTHMREYFARVKAYVEVKLNVNPHFLGERIVI